MAILRFVKVLTILLKIFVYFFLQEAKKFIFLCDQFKCSPDPPGSKSGIFCPSELIVLTIFAIVKIYSSEVFCRRTGKGKNINNKKKHFHSYVVQIVISL